MIKRFFILLLAIVASVGMSWASVTWISDQYGNYEEKGYNAGTPFTKDGVTVTMSDNAFFIVSYWGDASLQCVKGTFDPTAGNYVFSNSLGENFVKIIIAAGYTSDWEWFPKGDGWVLSGDEYNGYTLTWTGNASTVTLMDNELHSVNQSIEGDIVFMFESDSEEPAPAKLPGAFTINADGDKIVFSKGNLQATTTDLGANWTWDFAPNQWSLIGNAVANNAINGNKTVSANGTVDLFGWSTAATYYGIHNSWKNDDYTGDFVDWGALMGTEWRTLSRAEFYYIVYSRTDAYKKRGQATVNGVPGYVLLPDAWTLPSGLSFTNGAGNYTTNLYDGADWTAMENAGAVFLPAAGVREGTDIYQVNLYGWYWASTPNEEDGGKAYYLYFDKSSQGVTEYHRWKSKSVRLVTAAPIPPYEAVMNLINAIGTVELTAECKAKIDAARAAFDALSDGDKAQVTNIATLTTAEAAFDNVMDIWLSGDCDAILWKDTTLTVRKHAGEGNGAMADYTDYYGDNTAPWYNSHWYNPQPGDIVIKSVTLEEGVTRIGDYAFGWMSELKTITIPSSVTSIGEDAFYWSKAVDDIYLTADPSNLTWVFPYSADDQFKPEKATRCHVPADLLTAYQETFGTLNMTFVGDLDPITPLTPEQQQALDAAKGLINAIPSPVVYTPACKDAIDAARAAYDALTPDMLKQLVSNYKTLTDAEATYANLKDVAVVEAKINNIPATIELKLATRDSIESARAAYEALNAEQKALVPAADLQKLTDAEAALAALNPGGGAPADALNGKFTINAGGDQISFAKGNLQATTANLGETWTWGFAANQWNYLGIAVANSKINGNGTVSENGTVDLFGWSTAATYYGINKSYKAGDYNGDFVDWGPNMGAGWRTLTKDEWNYLIENNTKGRATVNDKSGYIFLPNDWSGPAFTPDPDNFTTNVYSGDDWTAMENAGAVFLPSGPARNGVYALIANDAKYSSSTSLNNDTSYVFTIYYNQSQSACTGTNRAYGCMVRLVTEGGSATPLDSAQVVKDQIEAIPAEITTDDACVKAIEDARAAYDALSEATKGALDAATVNKLTDAEAAYAILVKAEADAVVAKINNIPTPVELKLATRDSINNARAAYEALNAYQKPMVTNYQKLLDAEAALAEKNKGGSTPVDIVWDGNTGIANVDPNTTSPAYEGMTVTVGNGSSFSTYQNRLYFTFYSQPNGGYIFANENGTNITKVVIESTTALTSTMTEVDRMGSGWVISNENKTATWTGNADSVSIWKGQSFTNYWVVDMITFTVSGTATPLDSAQAVKDLIDDIPTPVEYPTSSAAIEAALNAFNELSDAAKGALDDADVQKLNDAATQYAALEAIAAIEAIPAEIVYDPAVKAAIETARDAFDALTPAQQALVPETEVQKLTNAEKAWADLVALIEHNVSYMGKDGELKNEKVALLHIPNPAPDFNGYEFVRWDVKAGDFLEEGLRIKAVYTPIITTNPVAYDSLMYNGTAQTLITAGVAKEGHIEYRINDGEWSAELPQATFAAAYVVYYKLVREGHEDYLADSIVTVIAKAPVTYTAPTAVENLVYNASNQTLIAAGQTNDGTFEYSLDPTLLDSWKAELPQAKDAGTYSVYYRVQGDLNHLDSVAATPVAVTIAKAELTATADDKNVIYGDAVPAYTVTYAGWQGNDDASVLTGDIAFACEYAATSNVGEYTITPSGATATNYNITFVNGKVTVAQAALMITAEDKNVTYGDAVPTYTATYSGWKNTDGASVVSGLIYTCEYAPTSNVGEYTIVPSGATATNYAISYTNGKVTVAQAALMITAENKEVTYGDAVPEYTATYSGWKNTDDASVVSGLVYTCEYAPTSNVGEYTITPSGATATNYNISYTNGKVTVAKADLMITADDKNVIYGDAVPTYTATYSGWKNSDDASVVSNLAYTCEYAPTSNVGEYTITPNSATAQNYAISYTNGKVTVAQATLTVTAEDKSVTYGDAAPAFTATYSGWKNTDDASVVSDLTLTSEYLVTSNVGTYDIVPANATALNYTFVYVNGTLTVNQAPLMITADDKSVEYGEVAPAFTASYSGWKNTDNESVVSGLTLTSEYLVTSNVGTYDIVPANASATNYAISYTNGTLTVNQAALTITAEDKEMIYGDEHPEFTASYSGWKNTDDESVVSGLAYTTPYAPGSYIGTYAINPNSATALNYAITFVDGTLTVNKAHVYVSDAEAQIAKFADGHANAVVLEQGVLNGIKLNDPIAHVTTAAFSSADVAENLTITLFYELTGDAALLNNYNLDPTSDIFTTEGVIIEPFIPDDETEPEDPEAAVEEGIEIYAYGYCDGSGYSLRYHLESGNPDQYMIDFADSRFTDVDWTNLTIVGKDGTIDIEIPVDMPTGDYTMTVYFRDSRFTWLESKAITVTFHVNLPETYVRPLFDNVIALVDTCNCLTDIQWYWRANSTDTWVAIPGANGYYYHSDTKLEGEFFVYAKMNGEPTYTCAQADLETLYGDDTKQAKVQAYPNPVITTTTVTIENSENNEHNVRIVNLMGAEAERFTFEGNETVVDMTDYPQGNYMISVDGIVVKVMKQ